MLQGECIDFIGIEETKARFPRDVLERMHSNTANVLEVLAALRTVPGTSDFPKLVGLWSAGTAFVASVQMAKEKGVLQSLLAFLQKHYPNLVHQEIRVENSLELSAFPQDCSALLDLQIAQRLLAIGILLPEATDVGRRKRSAKRSAAIRAVHDPLQQEKIFVRRFCSSFQKLQEMYQESREYLVGCIETYLHTDAQSWQDAERWYWDMV